MKSIKGIVLALFVVFTVVACAPLEEETDEVVNTTNPNDVWGAVLEDIESLEVEEEPEKEIIEVSVFPGQRCPFDTPAIDYVCTILEFVYVIINDDQTCPEDTAVNHYICSTRETELVALVGNDVCPTDTDTVHYRCVSTHSKYDFIHGQTAHSYSDNFTAHAPGLVVWYGNITGVNDSGDSIPDWAILAEKVEAVEFVIYNIDELGRPTLIMTDLLITVTDTHIEMIDIEGYTIIVFLPETLETIIQ